MAGSNHDSLIDVLVDEKLVGLLSRNVSQTLMKLCLAILCLLSESASTTITFDFVSTF
jgi:hypothetical protein